MLIIPFKISNTPFALDLDLLASVAVMTNFTPISTASQPYAGIILYRGRLIPVWNTYLLLGKNGKQIEKCSQFLEIEIDHKTIALPVEEVSPVDSLDDSWIEKNFFGTLFFRAQKTGADEKITPIKTPHQTEAFSLL